MVTYYIYEGKTLKEIVYRIPNMWLHDPYIQIYHLHIRIIKGFYFFLNYVQPCTAYSSYTLKSPYKLGTNLFDSVDKGNIFSK